ncbi:unnamed protein product [Leptidea sinapis]|uniref:Uncharacterized protein n=1 Tax=Leptidea sinapis TaxID=189913 RepID=A0A5E4R7N9_9NEOP|nr:unnamed protein product [Leptidea sinapis]
MHRKIALAFTISHNTPSANKVKPVIPENSRERSTANAIVIQQTILLVESRCLSFLSILICTDSVFKTAGVSVLEDGIVSMLFVVAVIFLEVSTLCEVSSSNLTQVLRSVSSFNFPLVLAVDSSTISAALLISSIIIRKLGTLNAQVEMREKFYFKEKKIVW